MFWILVSYSLIFLLVYFNKPQLLQLFEFARMYPSFASGFGTSRVIQNRAAFYDFVLADNERLRDRVDELEKIVSLQRNEIMLLQASTADVLRRLHVLEGGQHMNHSSFTSTMPRSSSQGARITPSRSTYAIAAAHPPRVPMSKSVYATNGDDRANRQDTPSRRGSVVMRNGQEFVNVPMGRSARGSPLRKWVSHQDVKENVATSSHSHSPAESPVPSTSLVTVVDRMPSRSTSLSLLSLSSSHRAPIGGARKNIRQSHFNAQTRQLQIYVANRPVSLPVPSSIETIDPASEQEAPDLKANLQHVFSYRGKDVRGNIDYLPTGDAIFFAANVVVLHNVEENTQRFYQEHTCDVKCIAVHPNKVVVASGQSSCHTSERSPRSEHTSAVNSPDELVRQLESEHTEAHVRIWDSVKLNTLAVIGGFDGGFEKGICQLSFSFTDAGTHLACVDESTKHTLSVWNWAKKRRVAEAKAANDVVFECDWHPTIKNLLALYGRGHFSFFNFDPQSGILLKNAAVFEGRDKPKTVLSMCFTANGFVLTGDSNGTISVWDPRSFRTVKQAHGVHPGGVYALGITKSGRLLSGGKDRILSEWQPDDLVRIRSAELPDDGGIPRVLVAFGSRTLVGTSTNTLLKFDFEHGFSAIVEGDAGEAMCVCTTTSASGGAVAVTCSADGGVRCWDVVDKRVVWSKNFMEGLECMDVDASGAHLLLGFVGGSWQIVSTASHETVEEHKESTQPITCVRFSPSASFFIVATKELSVMIYRLDASKRCQQVGRVANLTSCLVAADWDVESKLIRANSATGHVYFWARSGEVTEADAAREADWTSTTCRVSFESALIVHSSGGAVTCSGRSNDEKLLAVGMENGTVRLYASPVTSQTAGFVKLSGHSRPMRSVVFASPISLFTVDDSIFLWNLE